MLNCSPAPTPKNAQNTIWAQTDASRSSVPSSQVVLGGKAFRVSRLPLVIIVWARLAWTHLNIVTDLAPSRSTAIVGVAYEPDLSTKQEMAFGVSLRFD
jgi:hypothetical protein